MADNKNILGIDIGGTNIRAGLVRNNEIVKLVSTLTPAKEGQEIVLEAIAGSIAKFSNVSIDAIGVGVPSVVDVERGIVYDVVNIPAWKEVHLKAYLESKFNVPVFVNNDANCFVAGEKYYGKGKGYRSVVGLILGTGLGAGLIFNNKLYEGKNCGAGEIGNISYLEHNYEYYCCGQFFTGEYNISASEAAHQAVNNSYNALNMFRDFGLHVGNLLQMVLYTYDPELIILGGSVSKSYALFKDSMYKALETFMYSKTLANIRIEVSETENIAILGAASLYYNNVSNI